MSQGIWKKGAEGVEALREMYAYYLPFSPGTRLLTCTGSTGLPLSTYFSAIKLRWMIDHYPEVGKAHEEDDLLFGTIESWVAYVRNYSHVPRKIND